MGNLSLFPEASREAQRHRPKPAAKNGFVSSLWSFSGSNEPLPYRWYGTLPTALIERVLQLFSSEGDRVLDAFMGGGSVVRAAAQLNRQAIGLDVNPLACLMARARIEGLPSIKQAEQELGRITSEALGKRLQNEAEHVPALEHRLADDDMAYMRKWFREDTLVALAVLLERICEVKDLRIQRAFFLAAAQVVREVANVDPRCTHHLVTKKKPFLDPIEKWARTACSVLQSLDVPKCRKADASIRQESVLKWRVPKRRFELVLAHPPYLGVIHYHLIHRLATDLLGATQAVRNPVSLQDLAFDHTAIKANDVSTDASQPYGQFLAHFADRMQQAVAPDGRCVVIIGDQRHKGHLRHPFTECISEMLARGFLVEELFIWELQNNGGMHVLRRGHFIDHNYIIVFHKMGDHG